MIFDIHTHIVPMIDDGSSNMQESVKLLKDLKDQGVGNVLATPHFYADNCIFEEYTSKVQSLFNQLKEETQYMDMPNLFLGYEVLYFNNMSNCEELKLLTLNSSKYILIELPYDNISEKIIDEIYNIPFNLNLIPILAHVERYSTMRNYTKLIELIVETDVEAQVNADSFLTGRLKREALRLISTGICKYIGSDTHSLSTRPPRIAEAYKRIDKKLGNNAIRLLRENGDILLDEIQNSIFI